MNILVEFAWFAGPMTMVILLSSLLLIRGYPIDEKEHARIMQAIRHQQTSGN